MIQSLLSRSARRSASTLVTPGRVLLSVTGLFSGAGGFIFDWNETHIHNPLWPPHAKFHNAQTMSMGAALGATSLAALWGPGAWTRDRLHLAAGAASLYWVTQLSAIAYPGTALADPPHEDRKAQAVIATVALALNGLALALEERSFER